MYLRQKFSSTIRLASFQGHLKNTAWYTLLVHVCYSHKNLGIRARLATVNWIIFQGILGEAGLRVLLRMPRQASSSYTELKSSCARHDVRIRISSSIHTFSLSLQFHWYCPSPTLVTFLPFFLSFINLIPHHSSTVFVFLSLYLSVTTQLNLTLHSHSPHLPHSSHLCFSTYIPSLLPSLPPSFATIPRIHLSPSLTFPHNISVLCTLHFQTLSMVQST